ncbi:MULTISPECIES: phenylacetate--CoA ligase family protein [Moorena]|uniref:Coenzyme F390 synthetase n=1 Tax=Moorena producens 3L TaxID=489825 RepID=F4XSR6_9CYAN|nr:MULTISPECIES: phenylacetate--CoA ligase family protein [Moorena]EGJ32391.1 coenzyme F390 synthetase [Moorena producens 3L]NEP68575.1 phenylacetate--CoA ligase family protein [Moorena sp. SIO3A5]OLT64385.1 hypothetical protein BI334_04510 [Moorena producens 3L]
MNFRGWLYSHYSSLQGRGYSAIFDKLSQEITSGIHPETTQTNLIKILKHCQKNVPYYTQIMAQIGNYKLLEQNPEVYLQNLPVLTKDLIRQNFEQIKSTDLKQRQWYFNQSSGSTGEPIRLIQDRAYFNRSMAIKSLYSYFVSGRKFGDPQAILWGSRTDLLSNKGIKAKLSSFLRNTTYMNAFLMTPEKMAGFIHKLNNKPPKIIIAYVQAIYELAQFAEQEQITIVPQKAIITTSGTLYPWMREKIESVFQCQVFNRYGSREVGDIACELPGKEGLWAAPWGSYIEIVDDNNNLLPTGVEGNILVTNLTNYAMPLIRYKIGDSGTLLVNEPSRQIFKEVSGRITDMFKRKDGSLVYGSYFTYLLYFKDWIYNFQVVQKDYSKLVIRIMKGNQDYQPEQKELDEIVNHCQIAIGEECQISFEFVDQIYPSASGKYRYTISEI